MDTEMEITKINFIAVEDIKRGVGAEEQIGINIELLEPPHGHVLFLLQAEDAKALASGMIGDMGGPIRTPTASRRWSDRRSGRPAAS
jgi:chemotaxis protein CheC